MENVCATIFCRIIHCSRLSKPLQSHIDSDTAFDENEKKNSVSHQLKNNAWIHLVASDVLTFAVSIRSDIRYSWVGALSSSVDLFSLRRIHQFPAANVHPIFILPFREKHGFEAKRKMKKKILIRFYSVIALHRTVFAYFEHTSRVGLAERYLHHLCTNRTFDRTQLRSGCGSPPLLGSLVRLRYS